MLEREKFDIIIQGGQSNAEGSGIGSVEAEYQPLGNVFYLNAQKKVETIEDKIVVTYDNVPFEISVAEERCIQGEKYGDFALTFSKEYIKKGLLQNGRKLLIIRAAVGGTGFKKEHWGVGKQLYEKLLRMTDFALSLNPENKIVAFLWHQGEHDAFEGNTAENYHRQLKEMILDTRARYRNMPFIAGNFCNEWRDKNITICEPILKTIKQIILEIGNAGFVETSNLPSNNQAVGNGDDIHFCRQSLYELGKRYFKEFYKLHASI